MVANGLFPTRPELLDCIRRADYLVACDGAIEKLEKFREPDVVVGDLDSLSNELRSCYENRIYEISEQETNDLTKAMHFVREKGWEDVLILGATGLREDHTLGNISLLLEYMSDFREVKICSDYGCFTPIQKTTLLNSYPGQQISLFSCYPHGEISVQGLRYPINHRKLYRWWEATLNEAIGEQFSVILHEEGQVIIYQAW